MASNTVSVPYQNDASLNATLLLQKEAFFTQTNGLSDLLSNMQNSNPKILVDVKIPQLLSTRTLSEDYVFGNRLLENEEVAVLGFLDESGKISVSSRLNEFMLFMTRVTKAEHRALCIYIISSKTSDQCKKDFAKFGGLRIVKRWLKTAEESDFITEMTALVKLCNKLPFDEVAIREIGIGKVIRKLLKFQSPSNGDVSGLRVQVEALMANWRAKQQELASGLAAKTPEIVESERPAPAGSSELVQAISNRLVQQRGVPSQQNQPAHSAENSNGEVDKNESKEDDENAKFSAKLTFANNPHSRDATDTAMDVDGAGSSPRSNYLSSENQPFSIASLQNKPPPTTENAFGQIKPIGAAANVPKPISILSSLRAAAQQNQHAAQSLGESQDTNNTNTSTEDSLHNARSAPSVLVIRPPVARERKPLDMAEKARTMLAMRAQQALNLSNGNGAAPGEPGSPDGVSSGYGDASVPLSPSTSNVLSILSAVGKARVASGLQAVEQAPPLKGALKKPTEDGVKKEKKAIHWADENGGLLREVRTIEVAKIKRSTAHYSSTRELSKRERLAEKETHLSKAEDAMQKNTEWRTPVPLSLSIVVLDNISIVADSAEKDAQEKRLAHVLEVRYALDTQIPTDPDESPSVHEPSSSSARAGLMDGTSVGDDAAPATIPWYAPGTEPPPEEVVAPAAVSAADILRTSRNGYLDDHVVMELMSKLPYSLQTLDMNILRSLLQDPEALQSILRHDNTVDETNLAAYQRSLFMESNTRDRSTRFGGYQPSGGAGGDMDGARRSRWAVDAAGPSGGYSPSQPYNFEYDYGDAYAPPRAGNVGYNEYDRPPAAWGNPGYDAPLGGRPGGSLSVMDMRGDRRHAAPQSRFPTTKAATACRFFNTPKGCQFGDKCSFGHFLPNDAPPRAAPLKNDAYLPEVVDLERGNGHSRWGAGGGGPGGGRGGAMNGPGMRRFGEAPRQLSGPGSRLHSQTLPPAAATVSATAEVVDPTNGQPAKRAKTRFS